MIYFAYLLSTLFIAFSFIFVFYFYESTRSNEQQRKEWYGNYFALQQANLYASEQLGTYQWIDQNKGLVKVPIDVAISELIKQENKIK